MKSRLMCSCMVNIFMLSCLEEWALGLIFNYNLGDSSMFTMHRQLCWQDHDSTPNHISWYIQTYILHTKSYFIVHTFCTQKYIINEDFSSEFTMEIWQHEMWLPQYFNCNPQVYSIIYLRPWLKSSIFTFQAWCKVLLLKYCNKILDHANSCL